MLITVELKMELYICINSFLVGHTAVDLHLEEYNYYACMCVYGVGGVGNVLIYLLNIQVILMCTRHKVGIKFAAIEKSKVIIAVLRHHKLVLCCISTAIAAPHSRYF